MFAWDEAKRQRNLAKHGVDFESVWDMDWASAIRRTDTRKDYGEIRYVVLGFIEERLYCCTYTERGENKRIISLRYASRKERIYYEEEIIDDEAEALDQ